MNEIETRDILIATLESVKTQIMYVRNLHEAFSALFDTFARAIPELEGYQIEEIRKIRANPIQDAHIQTIDGLLARLRKYQS